MFEPPSSPKKAVTVRLSAEGERPVAILNVANINCSTGITSEVYVDKSQSIFIKDVFYGKRTITKKMPYRLEGLDFFNVYVIKIAVWCGRHVNLFSRSVDTEPWCEYIAYNCFKKKLNKKLTHRK